MKNTKKIVTPLLHLTLYIFLIIFLSACGEEPTHSSSETGSIAFRVEFHGAQKKIAVLSQAIDCGSSGIATVEAKVYDENDSYLIGGGPWNCEAHSGTITGVPAGLNRKVVILGKDSSGDLLYRGEVTGVTVTAGQTSSSGTIIAEPFQTTPLGPADSSTVTKGAFSFEWSSITGAAEYRIRVATDSSLINLIIDTTTTGATYTPSGLSYDTTYYWEVYPIDSYGNEGAGSGVWSFYISSEPGTPPSTPTNVTATAGDEQVTISWENASGATSYNIYWATSSGVTKSTGTKLTNVLSPYIHTGRTNGTTYYYVVTAENSYGESDESSEVSATPQAPDLTAPPAPISLTATPSTWTSTNSFSIDWTNPSDASGIAGAYYKLGSAPTSNTDGTYTTDKPFTVSATVEGGEDIYVWLVDGTGNIDYNNRSSTMLYYDATAPLAPTVTGTTPTNDTTPTWSWSSGGGGNGTFRYKLDDSNLTSGATETTSTSFTPSSALSEGSHTLYVQERDDAGNWSDSGSAAIVIDTTAPTDGILEATAEDGQVLLTWSNFSDAASGIDSYTLVYSTNDYPSTCNEGTEIYSGTDEYYTHTSLTNGQTYYYLICATDNVNNTSSGVTASATLAGTAPSAPTNVTATAGDEEVTISWDSVSDATSYNIYWSYLAGVSKANYTAKIDNIATNAYTHTNLTNGITYYYVVTAENSYGESNESSDVLATSGFEWIRLSGTSLNDIGRGIALDSHGNICITGNTGGNLDGNINAGLEDVFVSKYDSAGNRQWTKLMGSSLDEFSCAVAVGPDDNIYITGWAEGDLDGNINAGLEDIFISKYDADGTKQWIKLFGTADHDRAYAIAADTYGNIYITGYTTENLDGNTNAGLEDIFISKYEAGGNRQWTKLSGSPKSDVGKGIAVDSNGNVYATGYTCGDLDGNTNAGPGNKDIFIMKYDSDGNKQWTELLGTSDDDDSQGIAIGPSDNIYITGYTTEDLDGNTNTGLSDIFISKFDVNGNKLWTKLLGSPNNDLATDLTVKSNGNIYIAGWTKGELSGYTNLGISDILISKYDANGNNQWSRLLGSSDIEHANSIVSDSTGNIYMTGYTGGELGGNTNSGDYDIFICKVVDLLGALAPKNVTATAGDSQVTLSWDAVSGATSYNIYWATSQGVTKDTGSKISNVTSPYTHIGLTNGITYYYVVTSDSSYGESDESREVSATPWTFRLPDTGQTQSYTNTFGEDSDYSINPPSYTKLDAYGNDLEDTSTEWVMVRDNVTGLIWEVKTDDGSVHDKTNKYTWQQATDLFIANLNNNEYGGFSDWRLPAIKELGYLINRGQYCPTIDLDYFPNTVYEDSTSNYYWSSTAYACDSLEAWGARFTYGNTIPSEKSFPLLVRAVRGEESANIFIDNANNTVTDTITELMWEQVPSSGDWESAISYCESLTLGGYSDWRLPNIKELRSIVNYSGCDPAIDTTYFTITCSACDGVKDNYWSSTTNVFNLNTAWCIRIDDGLVSVDWARKDYNNCVRCVRTTQ